MADTKVSVLPTVTVSTDDYVYIVDAPGSTPGSGKALVSDMLTSLGLLTDTSGTSLTTKSSPTLNDLFFLFDAAASEAPVTSTGSQVVNSLFLVTSDSTAVTGADRVTNIMSLTQAEYDAIGAKDASTLYFITG